MNSHVRPWSWPRGATCGTPTAKEAMTYARTASRNVRNIAAREEDAAQRFVDDWVSSVAEGSESNLRSVQCAPSSRRGQRTWTGSLMSILAFPGRHLTLQFGHRRHARSRNVAAALDKHGALVFGSLRKNECWSTATTPSSNSSRRSCGLCHCFGSAGQPVWRLRT